MKTAFIGHRGTGKSALLKRVETYFAHEGRTVKCFDLDREIERQSHRSISEIFAENGERRFREIELETFQNLCEQIDKETGADNGRDVFLACGAGFDPRLIPESWRVIWIRRKTDSRGRVFLDRPRLDKNISAIDESQLRVVQREPLFLERADDVLWLDEGLDSVDEAECAFLMDDFQADGASVTVTAQRLRNPISFSNWCQSRLKAGFSWFELRDDQLNVEQMEMAIAALGDDSVLVSFRDSNRISQTARLISQYGLAFDWPLEFGECSFGEPRFLSLHERRPGESLKAALSRFPRIVTEGTQFKAALQTHDFQDLKDGDQWMKAFPEARIFLPMSSDGRWSWYRLLNGSNLNLNFVSDIEATAPDQPTLLQWIRRAKLNRSNAGSGSFAALLGDPAAHSRTPMEHESFFRSFDAPVFAIRVTEEEWRLGALSVLATLGLRWAAVTAPLKKLAYEICRERTGEAEKYGAINTLTWLEDSHSWSGTNTDGEGFGAMIDALQDEGPLGRIAVWGGGGTLNVVKAVLPQAELFSVRDQENRNPAGPRASDFRPDTVVWAVGRSREREGDGGGGVPQAWKPARIVDLNYSDDSPGRDYALQVGGRYISGLAMFRAQAEAQRQFWSSIRGDVK